MTADLREVREWMEFAGYLVPDNAAVMRRLWPTCECGAAMTPTDSPGTFVCPFAEMHIPVKASRG